MRFATVIVVIGLVAAACGSGAGTTETSETTETTESPGGGSVPGMLIASDIDRADPDAPASDVDAIGGAMRGFAADLYLQLNVGDGNLVYSPVSVYVALAMTYAGAAGTTADEMAAILGNDLSIDEFHAAMNTLGRAVDSRNREATEYEGAVEISIANSLWGQEGLAFEQAFLDLLALDYGAGMRVVDFVAPAAREAARSAINDWVAGETNDRIEDLIPDGVLDSLVRLVLVNAVYLNAAWLTPFSEGATSDGPFALLDGTEALVPMMHSDATMRTAQGTDWQAVELPYAGNELAMLIVMPDEGSFSDVEASLSEGLIDSVVGSLSAKQIVLSLPKFEIRTQAGLIPALQALGLVEATSDLADFSGMTGTPDLFISDVIHEAWISADEAGTEAAAATAVVMSLTAAPLEPVRFEVDRPFLFVLHDVETGSILFMGRVLDPSS
jgi:serpin B